MRTFTLELRMDDSEPERCDMVEKRFKELGAEALAIASLVSGKRKPIAKLMIGDHYMNPREVALVDELRDDGDAVG